MSEPHLEVTESPDPAAEAVVDGGLGDYNAVAGAALKVRRLAVFARDGEDVIGGLLARTSGRMCEIQILWVHEARRGAGHGARLLAAAEEEARSRGCDYCFLDTLSFQAPDFYASGGYEELYRHGPFDGGVEKIHMGKRL